MKYAIGHNVSLYKEPDINAKIIGTINDRVLIYNSFHTRQALNTYTRWAFVEFVGDSAKPSNQIGTQSFGYVLREELELVDDEITIFNTLGFNDVFIGDSYEKVIATFGKTENFFKDDYKWYVYQPTYDATTTFSHKTLTVLEISIQNPKGKNLKINDELSTESSVSDFIKFFDENGYKYYFDGGGSDTSTSIKAIINEEIMVVIGYYIADETIGYISILKYPEMDRTTKADFNNS